MAIQLSEAEINRLKVRGDLIFWRPKYSKNVHIRLVDGDWWTLCNKVRPLDGSDDLVDWSANFCEMCVRRAKMLKVGEGESAIQR